MSTTYELICMQCKVSLWIAQSSCGHGHLYTNADAAKTHYDFLREHLNHELRFVTSDNVPDGMTELARYGENDVP
jgi:hypothetical protein